MMSVILYDYWRSSASYRVRIGLALKGIAYKRVSVDLLAGAQRGDAHLARNPQGLVPALEIDGLTLTQSLAILEYLDETRRAAPLLPSSSSGRAVVRAIAHAIAMEIHPLNNLAVLKKIKAIGGEDVKNHWNTENIERGLAAVEALLNHPRAGQFCYEDTPGLAECCLIPQLYNAHRWGVEVEKFPRIRAIEAACSQNAAIASAHPDDFKPA
ncbi:maleylacetoacetate isomerase [Paracoccaceae bacterium GXU_MW_L88]